MYLDAFSGSAYPEERPPQTLLPITAKQLPGYGGSMETAAADLAHYQKMEFASLVLCGNRRRAEILECPDLGRFCWRRGAFLPAWSTPTKSLRF